MLLKSSIPYFSVGPCNGLGVFVPFESISVVGGAQGTGALPSGMDSKGLAGMGLPSPALLP